MNLCGAWLVALLSNGCNPQPSDLPHGSAPPGDPPDPFGWSNRVNQSSREDLSPLVAACHRQTSPLVDQFQTFAEPCHLIARGLELKFDRFYLDADQRVVAISGMYPDLKTFDRLKGLMNNPAGVAQYAGVCIRLGNNTLPELTIASKDHCEQLSLGLL